MIYQITKPVSQLPPLRSKGVVITTSGQVVDFIKQFNAICLHVEIHNRGGADNDWRINDENDLMTLKGTNPRVLTNIHIEKLQFFGTDIALFCGIAPIPLLKRFNAIEPS